MNVVDADGVPGFTDRNGVQLTSISADALVTTLRYLNTGSTPENLLMLVGIYEPGGKLIRIKSIAGEVQGLAVKEFKLQIDLPENSNGAYKNGYYAKVFLWDSATFVPVQADHRFP